MNLEQPIDRLSLRNLTPRFTLRALLIAVVLVAAGLRIGQWAWPKYVIYRQGREYSALQSTKEVFVEQQRQQYAEDKRNNPGAVMMAVDRGRPIPDDFAILVRRGDTFGCFIPRNQGKSGRSLEYDWYYRTDGLGRFSADNPHVKSGHNIGGPNLGGTTEAVKFGPFEIAWSGSANWGYVYYNSPIFKVRFVPDPASKTSSRIEHVMQPIKYDHLRICTTDVKSIELLDARDPKWIYIAYPDGEGVPGNVDLKLPPSESTK